MYPKLQNVSSPKVLENGNLYLDLGKGQPIYKFYSGGYIQIEKDSSSYVNMKRNLETLSDWNELFMRCCLLNESRRFDKADFSPRKIREALWALFESDSIEKLSKLNNVESEFLPVIYREKIGKVLLDSLKKNPAKTTIEIKSSPFLSSIYRKELKGKEDLPEETEDNLDLLIDLNDVGL